MKLNLLNKFNVNMNVIYQHFTNRKDEEFDYFDNVKRRRKTKDETASIERTEERRKLIFKTMCVSSQKIRMKKEEGAAVDSSAILPYLTSAGRASSLVRPDRQRSTTNSHIISGKES